MAIPKTIISLEPYLRGVSNVLTLGVRPNFSDYTSEEASLMKSAEKIYFPSSFYAELFDVMGKKIFPSYQTYSYAMDKIKQTALFKLLDIPHPKTRVFYGKKQMETILKHFSYPFVAKIPRGSAMGNGVYMIKNDEDLKNYLDSVKPAYIQEYIETDSELRVVVIGKEIALAYFKIQKNNEFRKNIAKGSTFSFKNIPSKALDLALETALKCRWDNVGIDIISRKDEYFVLEANMKYGVRGFEEAGIDYHKYLTDLVVKGKV